ncbi:MAG: CCA tRNA nucleotidyltransferase, partial [Nitrospirae bacterium]|nr:CCA tRNA nucleotidyltransferase [Nitrospirota bacterium]
MLRSKDELEDLLGSDPVNRKVFELFPYAYLVGGFIRDTYLGLNPVDRDFIVTYELSDFIDKLNSIFNASKVVLKDNLTIRLVLKDYKATIDVTRLYTPLYKDLYQRDFTINSIAYRPDTGIIDPTGGLEDLEYGLIKTIKEENLLKDPVRLIRAYRFLAELNGSIEEKTRQWIIKHKDRIKESAFERITLEIIKLLRADNAYRALFNGFKDSLLSDIFSLDISKLEYLIKNISYLFEKFKEVPEVLKKY